MFWIACSHFLRLRLLLFGGRFGVHSLYGVAGSWSVLFAHLHALPLEFYKCGG